MASPQRLSPVDRLLRLFTDIRAGESHTALLLTLNVFLLLTAYYVLKVVREALILTEFGAEVKAYASAGQVLLLAALVPAYGALAGRVPRRKLINIVTTICIGCLGAFYVLGQTGVSLGIVFFVWVGIFNVMIVAQAWAFANDVYTTDEGSRLFPLIGFGASAGAVCGSYLTRVLDSVGTTQLFLLAAVLLGVALIITNVTDARERRRTETNVADIKTTGTLPAATGQFRAETGEFKIPDQEYKQESGLFELIDPNARQEPVDETPESTGSAMGLVFRSRYLLLIALLMMILNWVNTTGEFILGRTVAQAAADAVAAGTAGGLSEQDFVRNFYGTFFSVVNLTALLAQLFLVSRIIKHFGIRAALLVLPVIAFIGYTILAFFPVLAAVRWAKTAENSTDYSLQNTVRNVLFLPTTREEKYKAKQAIDAFFWRAGDLLSAFLVLVGVNILMFQTRHFAIFNLVLVAIWIVLAVFIGRRYVRLAGATAQ
jgi:AAA family ATP:ADP antiporter